MILLWFYLIVSCVLWTQLFYTLRFADNWLRALGMSAVLSFAWPLYWIVCVRDYVLHKVLPRGE